MIIDAIATGRTVEAAIENACDELGFSSDDVEIEVIDLPSKKFFGLKIVPAKVRVFKEISDPKPDTDTDTAPVVLKPKSVVPIAKPIVSQAKPVVTKNKPVATTATTQTAIVANKPIENNKATAPLSQKAIDARNYFKSVIKAMGMSTAQIAVTERDGAIHLKILGEETGAAIGRRGETLDALQYLTSLAANKSGEDYSRIVLDSGNYRDKRKRTLEHLAKRLAFNAIKTSRPTTLEPMNPYERRIIHAAVAEVAGASSSSVGEEPNRCVVISSTKEGASEAPKTSAYSKGPRRDYKSSNSPRRDNNKSNGPRDNREKPEPYVESSKREVAPTEASTQPLYGKIEI